jgi:selenocysteine lyase/cysteine desulfurase
MKNVPVLSFNVKNKQCDEVAEHLAKANIAVRAGLHCAPTAHKTLGTEEKGTVRVSTGILNNEAQIDCFLSVIKKI